MELEEQLDEDFLFYLNFTNTFLRRIQNEELSKRAQVWLQKLIGEPCEGVQKKRCRNIYLSNLLVGMQNGLLEKPFMAPARDTDILNAHEVFGPIPDTVELPSWLNDTELDTTRIHTSEGKGKRGRTYVATRTLPNGQGAFAYVGISLTNEEPMWLGAGESSFDQRMAEKFVEMVPPVTEMEKILARRKDPKYREKVLQFYDALMQHIADELDGKEVADNETIEGLIAQLIHDLTDKNMYDEYEQMEESERRIELLLILFDRVKIRRDKVAKREEILDEIEEKLVPPKSFFDVSEPAVEDKYKLPAAMWEQVIEKAPARKIMELLLQAYPLAVVKKYVIYLGDYKEQIAQRMQRRHENVVSQMKKELRKEGEKMKLTAEEAERACDNAMAVLAAVKEQYLKKLAEERKQGKEGKEDLPEHSQLYEKMKEAMYDTQKKVEEEALRGKFLASQINSLNEQTEHIMNVSVDIIKRTEEKNIRILRNIKKLKAAIHKYELVIHEIKNRTKQTATGTSFTVQI
ncbi:uncharacterized protein LOC114345139 [Diabrotica virgifera virgifera]|uniref:DUF4485 domain-containing protein n=2 Tax=Diabrotica virgifera virgifera TaxID=50390 RepID=A0ABM5KZW9_DIAVI|nr:uncharacterized protein LOC114345139 [Diabrotica virgifera virgifera]